jgi:predicted DNA-binding transcriptional regulator YafY
MNLFEKIFNYQILSRLEDEVLLITGQERAWLKTMLQHPAAKEAFAPETLEKLESLLAEEATLPVVGAITEKARSREKQLYHPLIRRLRRMIAGRTGAKLEVGTKGGGVIRCEPAIPYKLEYSMVKREWYLLWYHWRGRRMMSTRLDKIVSLEEVELKQEQAERCAAEIEDWLARQRQHARIEVVPAYNGELSRILYAFSCFEKEVSYDDEKNTYHIRLTFSSNESEYVLQKLRFLGRRVKVVEGERLRRRMLETAVKSLARYGQG